MVTRFTTIFLRSIRGFLLWGSLVFLIGCSSSNQRNEPPPIEEPDPADLMILNAVANVSENIRKLETIDTSLSSPTQPQPTDKKERLIDIKWNGPLSKHNLDSTHFLMTIGYPQQNYPHPAFID